MATAVLAGIGVQAGFNTSNVVHQVVDMLLLHQVKEASFTHKHHILLNVIIGTTEVPDVLTIKVNGKDVGLSLGQQDGYALENFRIPSVQRNKLLLDVCAPNQGVHDVEFNFDGIYVPVNLLKVSVILIAGYGGAEARQPSGEISHIYALTTLEIISSEIAPRPEASEFIILAAETLLMMKCLYMESKKSSFGLTSLGSELLATNRALSLLI